jgi:hypothetical protein
MGRVEQRVMAPLKGGPLPTTLRKDLSELFPKPFRYSEVLDIPNLLVM